MRSEKQKPDGPQLHFHSHELPTRGESGPSILLQTDVTQTAMSTSKPPSVAPILLSPSLHAALSALTSPIDTEVDSGPLSAKLQKQTGNIFIIGGAEVYSSFLQQTFATHSNAQRILQTVVRKVDGSDFECDTFFPVSLGEEGSGWQQVNNATLSEWLNSGVEDDRLIQVPQGQEEWLRDDKAGVELKVIGWERVVS